MDTPKFNYEYIGNKALVTMDGYVIGYVESKKDPASKRGVIWLGHPGNTNRQGWVFQKPNMACVTRQIVSTYKKRGELRFGIYGEKARQQIKTQFELAQKQL